MSWRIRRQEAGALFVAIVLVLGGCSAGGDNSDEQFNQLPNPGGGASTELGNLNGPEGLTFDSDGNLFAGSQTGRITLITPRGEIFVFVETNRQLAGLAAGPEDEIYAAAFLTGEVLAVSREGTVRVVTGGLDSPNGIVFDKNKTPLVSAFGLQGGAQIARIERDGRWRTLSQDVVSPNGMAFGRDGRLYVAETFNNRVVAMTIDEAGDLGEPEIYASGLPLADGIAFDQENNLFVAGSGKIFVVVNDPEKSLREFTNDFTGGDVNGPASLAFGAGRNRDPGLLYFTNFGFPSLGTGTTVASVFVGIPGEPLFAP